ncbi:hypothetical protein EXIGLDRAFT_762036 [Exidia glandulosa HHB12029]|uniref:F-box domain-containing protein n=1 Tax=Exidia glandulosa HHB12029 TaxID=1314781 RepID=A0A165N412_EXIGL|nr:hypothetical protein EXIGLDRAFT_762036 [Exidia glandulosa HHB12029]
MDRIPDDVLRVILDKLWLGELVRIMRVSSRWHALIMDLPVYWRDISLGSPAPSDVNFFLHRMRMSSSQRPIRVSLPIFKLLPSVVTAIAEHLHHIQHLDINVPIRLVEGLLIALANPAPMLEKFSFILCHLYQREALPTLPATLFARNAPLLRTVSLENILFAKAGLACFAHVTKAHMACSIPIPLPVAMSNPMAMFPIARHVSLLAADARLVTIDESIYDSESWRNVESLELSGRAWGQLRLPLEAIPRITFSRWDPSCVEMALGHIRGCLELHLETSGSPYTTFTAHIVGSNGSRTLDRSFGNEAASDWLKAPDPVSGDRWHPDLLTHRLPHSLLKHGPLIDRTVTLRLSGGAFFGPLLQLFDPLPALERLIIEDVVCLPQPPSTVLRCPNLRDLVLVGSPELCRPTQEEVDEFIRVCLITGRLPLRVEPRNFTIDPSDWRGADPSFIVIANEAAGAEQ